MKQKKTITRREFLGIAGASGLVRQGFPPAQVAIRLAAHGKSPLAK